MQVTDEDKVEQAIQYAHDVGFDEGYQVGYEDGYMEGRYGEAESAEHTRPAAHVRDLQEH